MYNYVIFTDKNGGPLPYSCKQGEEQALLDRKLVQQSHCPWGVLEVGPGGFESGGAARRAAKARILVLQAERKLVK